MLSIGRLWNALARLAGAVEGLALTVEQTNTGLRQRLHLDGTEGHVIEANGGPQAGEVLDGSNGTSEEENFSQKGRTGRKRQTG